MNNIKDNTDLVKILLVIIVVSFGLMIFVFIIGFVKQVKQNKLNKTNYIHLKCELCGNDFNSNNKRYHCNYCKKIICKNCWKYVICTDCFELLPYDKKKLVDVFIEKFKKKKYYINTITGLLFILLILGFFSFGFPFWITYVFFGLMMSFLFFYLLIPIVRLNTIIKREFGR